MLRKDNVATTSLWSQFWQFQESPNQPKNRTKKKTQTEHNQSSMPGLTFRRLFLVFAKLFNKSTTGNVKASSVAKPKSYIYIIFLFEQTMSKYFRAKSQLGGQNKRYKTYFLFLKVCNFRIFVSLIFVFVILVFSTRSNGFQFLIYYWQATAGCVLAIFQLQNNNTK